MVRDVKPKPKKYRKVKCVFLDRPVPKLPDAIVQAALHNYGGSSRAEVRYRLKTYLRPGPENASASPSRAVHEPSSLSPAPIMYHAPPSKVPY
jgi:hypothetical protein